jgi:hypothetical protein
LDLQFRRIEPIIQVPQGSKGEPAPMSDKAGQVLARLLKNEGTSNPLSSRRKQLSIESRDFSLFPAIVASRINAFLEGQDDTLWL